MVVPSRRSISEQRKNNNDDDDKQRQELTSDPIVAGDDFPEYCILVINDKCFWDIFCVLFASPFALTLSLVRQVSGH